MKTYDFDATIDRSRSDAIKHRGLRDLYGRDDLIPLWVADMDFACPPEITEALARRIEHPVYGYPALDERFYPSIRSWLSRRHHLEVAPEEITYVPGIVRAIGLAINYFCNKGEKVLIQPPVYHPFRIVAEGNGCVMVHNPIRFDGSRFSMDLDELRRVVETERPRLMVLCNPQNPTGMQWTEEELRTVAAICAANDVIVISDEIHSDLMLYGNRHIPFLSVSDDARKVGIMFGAPSKTFNIPGLVSSWCVIKNPELREGFFNWLGVNEFNVPTFFAAIATVAAYDHGEEWLDQAIDYIGENIRYTAEAAPRITGGRIRAIIPDASYLVWLDCRNLGMTHEQLKAAFIDQAGLALIDGETFGAEGRGFMRMNVAMPRARLVAALNRLRELL